MTSQPPLKPPDKRITGANDSPIACYGKADIKVTFHHFSCRQTFYICEDDVSPLLGRDFMRANDVYTRPAHNAVYKDGKKIPAYDLASKVRNRVSLISSITIKPGEEIQTVAHIQGKRAPDDITCLVQPAKITVLADWRATGTNSGYSNSTHLPCTPTEHGRRFCASVVWSNCGDSSESDTNSSVLNDTAE